MQASTVRASELNKQIAVSPLLGHDFEIGHTYFFKIVGLLERADYPHRQYRINHVLWTGRGEPRPPLHDLWRLSLEPLIDQYLQGVDAETRAAELKRLGACSFAAKLNEDAGVRRPVAVPRRPKRRRRRLTKAAVINPRDYRIGIDDDRRQDDEWLPLVDRGRDGRWWPGRFIGSMTIEGQRLIVRPRLRLDLVEAWLDQAFGLVAPPASAHHVETETFIVRLLTRLWCRAIDNATRHGLPLLGLPRSHEGLFVRGRSAPAR